MKKAILLSTNTDLCRKYFELRPTDFTGVPIPGLQRGIYMAKMDISGQILFPRDYYFFVHHENDGLVLIEKTPEIIALGKLRIPAGDE